MHVIQQDIIDQPLWLPIDGAGGPEMSCLICV